MSYQLCIPPYFTNVLRAFGTIEGIALKVDPGYSIVQVRATLGRGEHLGGGYSIPCQTCMHLTRPDPT